LKEKTFSAFAPHLNLRRLTWAKALQTASQSQMSALRLQPDILGGVMVGCFVPKADMPVAIHPAYG